MATYYKWRKSNIAWTVSQENIVNATIPGYIVYVFSDLSVTNGKFVSVSTYDMREYGAMTSPNGYCGGAAQTDTVYGNSDSGFTLTYNSATNTTTVTRSGSKPTSLCSNTARAGMGQFIEYVYSQNPSAYPNGGTSDGYYYDQRTTVTSPLAPSGITYPATIFTPSVFISWTAAISNTNYAVSQYEVSYSTNEGNSWTVAGTTADTSYSFDIPAGTMSITFRVRAKDNNGQWGNYATGTESQVLLAPTLTVPSIAMQGQQITPNWTAVEGADSYTLQRKSSADEDWVEVYSGADTSYTETVGTWTSIQYRVQAVFDDTPGGWATSNSVPVISASALVISGQDGDLGTLVNDVPYTISTDTGNAITIRTTVNGAVILEGTVPSGTAERIPVLDLVNGDGTIVIEASVETDSGTVCAVRAWTYTKAPITFPNAGSPAQLTKEGKNVWPKTLAECVRLPGGRTLEEVMGFPCQVFMGSYIGTGVYGVDSPNELTFPFKPKAVVIGTNMEASETYNQTSYLWLYGMKRGQISSSPQQYEILNWEDNTLSWYYFQGDAYGANRQFNAQGVGYFYAAFG
ncbi:fibronectin type III domain-containing protein [Dysosmobacter sp. Marseille-Q4140]|nr:fibronectin type III domain-containing protein [Dysosmobacter sp. Marseille-Q4140]